MTQVVQPIHNDTGEKTVKEKNGIAISEKKTNSTNSPRVCQRAPEPWHRVSRKGATESSMCRHTHLHSNKRKPEHITVNSPRHNSFQKGSHDLEEDSQNPGGSRQEIQLQLHILDASSLYVTYVPTHSTYPGNDRSQ